MDSYKSPDGFNLGSWVNTQRTDYLNKKIEKARQIKLNKLGFIWEVNQGEWEKGYSHLLQYKKEHGNCSIIQQYRTSHGYNLGFWVTRQRQDFKRKLMSNERILKLKEIGFFEDK